MVSANTVTVIEGKEGGIHEGVERTKSMFQQGYTCEADDAVSLGPTKICVEEGQQIAYTSG